MKVNEADKVEPGVMHLLDCMISVLFNSKQMFQNAILACNLAIYKKRKSVWLLKMEFCIFCVLSFIDPMKGMFSTWVSDLGFKQ